MFSISRYELIETGVYSGKEVAATSVQHLGNSLQIGSAGAAEFSLVQIISSARGAEHSVHLSDP
jgi:hypothetical protein